MAATACEMLELDRATLDEITAKHPRVREVLQRFTRSGSRPRPIPRPRRGGRGLTGPRAMAQDPADKPKPPGAAHPGSGLRHDLRTPVNQIIGYSEMLDEDAQEAGQEKMSADLKRIGQAARSLLPLIDRIPTISAAAAKPAPPVIPSPPRRPAPEAAAPPPAAKRPSPAAVPQFDDTPSPATLVMRAAVNKPADGTDRVLVVDDNELNRDMLSRRLKSRGYAVMTAGRRAAVPRAGQGAALRPHPPRHHDAGHVRDRRAEGSSASGTPWRSCPIIMATAKDQGTDVVEALTLGANDYVTKPLDFPVVLARVENQLSLKRAMEEIKRLANELEKRNRFIKHTFGRYLSEEVVDRLLDTRRGTGPGRREARGHAAHVRPARLHRPWPTASPRSRSCACSTTTSAPWRT